MGRTVLSEHQQRPMKSQYSSGMSRGREGLSPLFNFGMITAGRSSFHGVAQVQTLMKIIKDIDRQTILSILHRWVTHFIECGRKFVYITHLGRLFGFVEEPFRCIPLDISRFYAGAEAFHVILKAGKAEVYQVCMSFFHQDIVLKVLILDSIYNIYSYSLLSCHHGQLRSHGCAL